MDELSSSLEQLKISAFTKVSKINHCINEITIGPNSNCNKNKDCMKNDLPINSKQSEINKNFAINSKNEVPIRHILKEIELQRQEKVSDAIQAHLNRITEFSRQQEVCKNQQWLRIQQAFIDDIHKKESHIFEALNEYDKNISNEQARLVQYYQDLAERRKIHEKELAIREKQRQLINLYIDNVKKCQQEFRSIYQQIIAVIRTCSNNEDLKTSLGDDFRQLKTLPEQLEEVIINCKNGNITETEMQKATQLVLQVGALQIKIEKCVANINEKKKLQIKSEITTTIVQSVSVTHDEVKPKNSEVKPKNSSEKSTLRSLNLMQYVSMTNLKIYTEIMDFLEKHTECFKTLDMDSSQKQFKFECKKAINTPVNSLSGVNSSHILDKYNKLHALLSGQTVMVGEKQIKASSHPQGISFCMDLLAKKFVLQGDVMVSSNPESAFCYATVIVSLWNEFPTFGKLILAYFYKFCPYLVPYYIPRQVEESDEEFYIKQGYQYIDGQIEKQDKFLKRMTGIMRLYSAIMIVKPKSGQSVTPYNIKHGWRWLSSVIKLEPRVDISATMVHTFLEVVGFELEARYCRFFKKLLRVICENFLTSCREKCTGGAVTRLELLMTEYIKNGRFVQPSGYLNYAYW